MTGVRFEADGPVAIVTIDRPGVRNAVDGPTAASLVEAFVGFDADESLSVAILTGAEGTFCAGADLGAFGTERQNAISGSPGAEPGTGGAELRSPGPMGPTRMRLGKPVIAAVEGHAVAGGLELALWCDLRVAARDAVFGVFCRRFGVPLIDGGTVRLPKLVGLSHALDLILTGRPVSGEEALRMGLANRLVEPGAALSHALEEAHALARLPQRCLRSDRLSAYESLDIALDREFARGLEVIASGETAEGAERFRRGAGRHGTR